MTEKVEHVVRLDCGDRLSDTNCGVGYLGRSSGKLHGYYTF